MPISPSDLLKHPQVVKKIQQAQEFKQRMLLEGKEKDLAAVKMLEDHIDKSLKAEYFGNFPLTIVCEYAEKFGGKSCIFDQVAKKYEGVGWSVKYKDAYTAVVFVFSVPKNTFWSRCLKGITKFIKSIEINK